MLQILCKTFFMKNYYVKRLDSAAMVYLEAMYKD